MGTNGATGPKDLTERVAAPRARRESFQGLRISWRAIGSVVGLLSFAGILGVGIWASATAFGGKANSSELRTLEQRHQTDFHRLDKKVDRIYLEQRAFIRYVAPDLELDKKAGELTVPDEGLEQ